MLNRGSSNTRLGKAYHVLHVLSTQPDIAQYFGLTGNRAHTLDRGWALYHRALAATGHRMKKWGEALNAGARCTQTFQAARAAQGRLTALARLVITDPAERDRLALSGRRADAVGAWRCRAELFHANLTDEDRVLLNDVGVDVPELDQAAALLVQLAQDHAACIAAKASARSATSAKTTAFQELAAFLSVLIGIARVLEPDHPDLLPQLRMKPDGRRRPSPPNAFPAPASIPDSAPQSVLTETDHGREDEDPKAIAAITSQNPLPALPQNAKAQSKSTKSNRTKNKRKAERRSQRRTGAKPRAQRRRHTSG